MQAQWRSERKPLMAFQLAPWPLTLDDLEHSSSGSQDFYRKCLENGERYDDEHNGHWMISL